MEYIDTVAEGVHLYRCLAHGEWELGPGGIYRPSPEDKLTNQESLVEKSAS